MPSYNADVLADRLILFFKAKMTRLLVITRDIHFVMSVALPFVNYVSHTVKTCIKRNFKSYSVTMNKTVVTSLAVWLFDVIKNVMSSTRPERKGLRS